MHKLSAGLEGNSSRLLWLFTMPKDVEEDAQRDEVAF
jgi:hypothetical protein